MKGTWQTTDHGKAPAPVLLLIGVLLLVASAALSRRCPLP